jgi:tetratricopeptide (TPR) repeat protein
MQTQANRSMFTVAKRLALAVGLFTVAQVAMGQAGPGQGGTSRAGDRNQEENPAQGSFDAQTGTILNEAIELMNMENFAGAQQKLATLKIDKLSPYERGKVEQIFFNISYSQEKYQEARDHLRMAIESGGLNDQEVSEARFQSAQLFLTEEKYKEGAAALEEWMKTAPSVNSAAYYLLAAAYYQLEDFDRALPPAKKAVELMDKPQENWLGMLSALYMQKEQYREAVPIVEQLIAVAPGKKTYWINLSSIYGQMEDYPKALGVMQLAYSAGLVTEDAEVRRLADLLLYNEVPYRCAQVLEAGVEKKLVTPDDKFYEKLATCWIGAAELDKAIPPLTRAAELAQSGDLFVRLGEVQVNREDWGAAQAALQRGIDKGQLKDTAGAQLMMGIALFNQDKLADATTWFQRARSVERYRDNATAYLQLIQSKS